MIATVLPVIGKRQIHGLPVHRRSLEHRIRPIHLIEVAKDRPHLTAGTEGYVEKILRAAFFGADVHMGTGIVGKRTGLVHLAHRDVLHGGGRKDIQRYQFVIRVG